MPDWDEIKTQYVAGEGSLSALAEKNGVSLSALKRACAAGGWVEERNKAQGRVFRQSRKRAPDPAEEYRRKIYAVTLKIVSRLEEIVDSGAVGAGSSCLKPRDLTGAIKDISDILDVRSDAELEERTVKLAKLTAEAEQREGDGGDEIVVRIEGCEDEWSE